MRENVAIYGSDLPVYSSDAVDERCTLRSSCLSNQGVHSSLPVFLALESKSWRLSTSAAEIKVAVAAWAGHVCDPHLLSLWALG